MLTEIVNSNEERDVMTSDVGDKVCVIMKIAGVIVNPMVEMEPYVYGPYVVYENGRKLLYVQVLKDLYAMLVASLQWYKKFRKDLEK